MAEQDPATGNGDGSGQQKQGETLTIGEKLSDKPPAQTMNKEQAEQWERRV
jgi:hypothetical protein